MQHSAELRIAEKNLHRISVGLTVMDYNRLIQSQCQLQLIDEKLLLLCLAAVVPVIVQADLTNCHTLFMGCQLSYNIHIT